MSDEDQLNQRVIDANVELHTQLADKYMQCEPHFRPENVEKVETLGFNAASASQNSKLGSGSA